MSRQAGWGGNRGADFTLTPKLLGRSGGCSQTGNFPRIWAQLRVSREIMPAGFSEVENSGVRVSDEILRFQGDNRAGQIRGWQGRLARLLPGPQGLPYVGPHP